MINAAVFKSDRIGALQYQFETLSEPSDINSVSIWKKEVVNEWELDLEETGKGRDRGGK
jgi:hypothetical protein